MAKSLKKRTAATDVRFPGPDRDVVRPTLEKKESRPILTFPQRPSIQGAVANRMLQPFPGFPKWPKTLVVPAIPATKVRMPYTVFKAED